MKKILISILFCSIIFTVAYADFGYRTPTCGYYAGKRYQISCSACGTACRIKTYAPIPCGSGYEVIKSSEVPERMHNYFDRLEHQRVKYQVICPKCGVVEQFYSNHWHVGQW